jgi:hypothetical protein
MYKYHFFVSGICLFYIISASHIKIFTLFKFIKALGLVQSFLCILDYFGYKIFFHLTSLLLNNTHIINPKLDSQIFGSMGNQNVSGALLALTIPAFLGSPLIIFPLIAIFLTSSSMAMMTALGCIMYYYYNKTRFDKLLPWVGFGAVAFYFPFFGFPTGYFSDSMRAPLWNNAMLFIRGNELTGRGLGSFSAIMHQFPFKGTVFDKIHNEYLEVNHAFGILGMLIIMYVLITSIFKTNNNIILCGMFATAINCYGNFTFHITSTAILGLIYFGVALGGDFD